MQGNLELAKHISDSYLALQVGLSDCCDIMLKKQVDGLALMVRILISPWFNTVNILKYWNVEISINFSAGYERCCAPNVVQGHENYANKVKFDKIQFKYFLSFNYYRKLSKLISQLNNVDSLVATPAKKTIKFQTYLQPL